MIMTNINSQNTSNNSRVGSYDIIDTIGHGNFSVCKLAKNVITNQKVNNLYPASFQKKII